LKVGTRLNLYHKQHLELKTAFVFKVSEMMEKNKEQNQNQNQGKKSTAKTDVTYNRDAEDLKNSATTSQGYATSSPTIGTGGGRTEERTEDAPTPDFEK
jgi:hypothetical protein